ncbi:paraplegin-like [Galendromus occidentalis]|uniref:Paraplegin-like n=1 Tax=Galendromus occidentalis TaxID=34638 RepID=A0AAJ6QVN4_9ACAR|nr:paraplegin-like [Galendromus occidentalis]
MSSQSFARLFRVISGHRSIVLSHTVSRRLHLQCRVAQRLLERSLAPHQHGVQQRRSNSSKPGENKEEDKKDDKPPERSEFLFNCVKIAIALNILNIAFNWFANARKNYDTSQVTWNDFYHNMLAKGEVEAIVVRPEYPNTVLIRLTPGAVINGKVTDRRSYFLEITSLENFEAKLREAEKQLGVAPGSVPVVYARHSGVVALINVLLIVGLMYAFVKMRKRFAGKSTQGFLDDLQKAQFTVVDHTIDSTRPKVRFSDVAGCHGAKVEIGEFIDYLQDAEKYKKLGAKHPKGVLLLGPPGCGKTMLAKAVAAEAQVPFLAMAGSEFIEMIGGLGASRVRNLFQEARKRAPCIIYIDEIDAIGRQRSFNQASTSGEEEQTLNQLLSEMDGISTKEGVIMLASTNRGDLLDKALLRPGRFDRHILIDLPNLAERVEIYEKHLGSIMLEKSPSTYSQRLAQLTPGFSGADIANVCNEAALHAARLQKHSVTSEDIDYAVERVVGGTEKKTHAMSPEERRRVAVHESGHAIVSWLLESTDDVLKISIVPRTKGTLGMARYVPTEQKLFSSEDLFERICAALGGRAAEVIVYGQPSTGAEDDLKKVTEIAKAIVEQYGMDAGIGTLSYTDRKPYSKKLANTMDFRASRIVQKAFETTVNLVRANQDKLKALTDELFRKEVLERADVEAILGPRPRLQKAAAN